MEPRRINYLGEPSASMQAMQQSQEQRGPMTEYETDILLWSEHQAALLRRVAAGERINDQVDWANVIEEIESVGRSERRACEGSLRQALAPMLKIQAWPNYPAVEGWEVEAARHRLDAADAFEPSMRQRIDLAKLYRQAIKLLPETIDGQPPLPVPEHCPVTLDELPGE